MITLELIQGSDLWHTHRKTSLNASDAPAMMGCSSYKTRDQLIAEKATGIYPEVDAATQRRFDSGHRFEALARPLAESIVGDELFPVVGMEGILSASLDGLTMAEDVVFEHKTLSKRLREVLSRPHVTGKDLPMEYQIQLEQQCAVSECDRALFMASNWDADGRLIEEFHCWYEPNLSLRADIAAGWSQFQSDLADYVPPATAAPAPIGRAPSALPALHIEVKGAVTASNLAEFRATALEAIHGVNRELKTDEDFASAELSVKWCGDVESRIAAAKQHALSQTTDIDLLFRTMDEISAEARRVRLDLTNLVKAQKESLRGEIVASGVTALREHIASLNTRIGKPWMLTIAADFGGSVKGRRTIDSLRSGVADELARAKAAANMTADLIVGNLTTIDTAGHPALFADAQTLCVKDADYVSLTVKSRIAEHTAAEQRRLDAERETIRMEEQAKAQREADARLQQERDADAKRAKDEAERAREAKAAQSAEDACRKAVDEMVASREQPVGTALITDQPGLRGAYMRAWNPPEPAAVKESLTAQTDTGERMSLGAINEHLAPIRIDAAGLASLGFEPVEQVNSSRLYRQQDLLAICAALIRHLQVLAVEVETA